MYPGLWRSFLMLYHVVFGLTALDSVPVAQVDSRTASAPSLGNQEWKSLFRKHRERKVLKLSGIMGWLKNKGDMKKVLKQQVCAFCWVIILLWSYGAKIGRVALMPRLWNALALFKDTVLSGHQYLRLSLGNPQIFNLLLYLLTFLHHHIGFICKLLIISASSSGQVMLTKRQKSVDKSQCTVNIATNVYTWPLPSKVGPFVCASSESFPSENSSLQWLKRLVLPRRWTKQKVQTICSLL